MFYADTSVLVKLYFKEKFSSEVAGWVRQNNEAIPLTLFHELEFTNAIRLKQFRQEMTADSALAVFNHFSQHQKSGVYFRHPINWVDAFGISIELAQKYTPTAGTRSLDILHVALAVSFNVDQLLTLDKRQADLAALAGLKVVQGVWFDVSV